MPFSIDKAQVVWRMIDGEATLVHVETSFYYALNATGTFIWNLLAEQDMSFEQIVHAVSAEYEMEPAAVTTDIRNLLQDLKQEHLIIER